MPSNPRPRFPLRGTPGILGVCHVALDTYARVARRHPETLANLKRSVEFALEDLRKRGTTIMWFPYPESLLLADALSFVLADGDAASVQVLRPTQRREAQKLFAALEDYNCTQAKFWNERREKATDAVPRDPTPAEREEHRLKERRDAIFRDMVEQVDVWGNVVDAHGGGEHTDLRKHAKTVNFMPHPLQSNTVKSDDPKVREKLAEGIEKLKELTKQARR